MGIGRLQFFLLPVNLNVRRILFLHESLVRWAKPLSNSKFGIFLMPKILYNVSRFGSLRGKRAETGCHLQLSESSLYYCFSWLIGFEILMSYVMVVSKKKSLKV